MDNSIPTNPSMDLPKGYMGTVPTVDLIQKVVTRIFLGLHICVGVKRPILDLYQYVCGWPPHPAVILKPIEHFEITSSCRILGQYRVSNKPAKGQP